MRNGWTRNLPLLLTLVLTLACHPAHAGPAEQPRGTVATADEINAVISTLESHEARRQLIRELRTLREARVSAGDTGAPISGRWKT